MNPQTPTTKTTFVPAMTGTEVSHWSRATLSCITVVIHTCMSQEYHSRVSHRAPFTGISQSTIHRNLTEYHSQVSRAPLTGISLGTIHRYLTGYHSQVSYRTPFTGISQDTIHRCLTEHHSQVSHRVRHLT